MDIQSSSSPMTVTNPEEVTENTDIKILLVEDDFFLSDIYQTKLSVEGFSIAIAEDGAKGVELAKSFLPDLILLDIMLPKMDGLEVLRSLKGDASTKDIPVILLSNLGQEFVVKGGMDLGAVDYLLKSDLTPREVIVKVRTVLKQKQESA